MHQVARSSVFLSGMGGLGVEIGESVALCHVKKSSLKVHCCVEFPCHYALQSTSLPCVFHAFTLHIN